MATMAYMRMFGVNLGMFKSIGFCTIDLGGPYFAFLKILKIAVLLLKDMYSGMPKIGLKNFLVKTQKSAGLSKIYLVNSLSVCNELTSKSQTRAADFCFLI